MLNRTAVGHDPAMRKINQIPLDTKFLQDYIPL